MHFSTLRVINLNLDNNQRLNVKLNEECGASQKKAQLNQIDD